MLSHLDPSTEVRSCSHDTACTEVDSGDTYSPEFLNSLETGGLPPHELRLRHGSLVILLRNFAPHKGLCNGTRLVVENMHKYFLVVRVVTGPYAGNVELLPRICCDSCGDCELPFILRRHQFPVKPAWVITINKSQGQSISGRLGIYLPAPVFAHGQLYVAYSRSSSFETVRCVVDDSGDDRQTRAPGTSSEQPDRCFTTNIVDRQLLKAAQAFTLGPDQSEHVGKERPSSQRAGATTTSPSLPSTMPRRRIDRADLATATPSDSRPIPDPPIDNADMERLGSTRVHCNNMVSNDIGEEEEAEDAVEHESRNTLKQRSCLI